MDQALLSELNAKRYELMRNAEAHCRLEASWEVYKRDIDSVEQVRQSCADTASQLEERLRRLQGDLHWRGGYHSGDSSPNTFATRSAIGAGIASWTTVATDTECTNESTPPPSDQETAARTESDGVQDLDVADDDDDDSPVPLATVETNELNLVERSPAIDLEQPQQMMIHPDHALKLQQYLVRIQALEKDIVICQQSQQALSERRAFLGLQLVQEQERILELNSEVDRVALYDGQEIISNVLHGSDQKFTVFELKRDLQEELRAVKGNIAMWKAEIIGGDMKVEKLKANLIAMKLRVIERKGALKAFQSQLKSADHIRTRLNDTTEFNHHKHRDANSILKHLQQWRSIARKKREIGSALDSLSKLLTRRTCTKVLRLWLEAVHATTAPADGGVYKNGSAEAISELSGAGDALLVQAQKERHGNARDLVSIMSKVAAAEGPHAPAPEFLTDNDRTLFFKANFYYAADDLNDALRSYKLLLESLSRASDTVYAVSASREDMAKTSAPDAPAIMISSLVHENTQEFDTAELIYRLDIRREEVLHEVDVAEEHRRRLLVTIKNLQDDLEGIRNDMQVENGALMQRIHDKRIIRCMALSSSNVAGNDVMGGATGGVEYCVLSDIKLLYAGQKLIVRKGDPNSRTKAEVRAERSIQREQDREERMMRLCLKSDLRENTGRIDEAEDAASKIEKMVKLGLADDPATLFNRCAGKRAKKKDDVASISTTASHSDSKRKEMGSSGKGTLSLRLRRQ